MVCRKIVKYRARASYRLRVARHALSVDSHTGVSEYILACRRGSRLQLHRVAGRWGHGRQHLGTLVAHDAGGQVVTWQAHGSAIPAHSRAVGSNPDLAGQALAMGRRPDCQRLGNATAKTDPG